MGRVLLRAPISPYPWFLGVNTYFLNLTPCQCEFSPLEREKERERRFTLDYSHKQHPISLTWSTCHLLQIWYSKHHLKMQVNNTLFWVNDETSSSKFDSLSMLSHHLNNDEQSTHTQLKIRPFYLGDIVNKKWKKTKWLVLRPMFDMHWLNFVIWCDLVNVKSMMIYDLHIKYIIYGPLLCFPQTPPPTTW